MVAFSFPFIGAGEARYFEWAEVHVRFVRAPTTAEYRKISGSVPVPLRDSIELRRAHLMVASAQGVGRLIKAAYSKPPRRPGAGTTRGKFTMASSAQYQRFNAAIERWLRKAHSVVPILIAFRAQDHEAGGTAFSAWHHASMRDAPAVLRRLGKPKRTTNRSIPERFLYDGILAELNAVEERKPPQCDVAALLADHVMDIGRRQAGALVAARAQFALLDSAEGWWHAANDIADAIASGREVRVLANTHARDIALTVFCNALTGKRPADHVRAFKFLQKQDYPIWRLARIIAVAVEAALRARDTKALVHFKGGIDRKNQNQIEELERCATELVNEGLGDLAEKLRAIADSGN